MKKLLFLFGLILSLGFSYGQTTDHTGEDVEFEVKLFPNPATNVINVLGLKNSQRADILITDMYGKPVLQHQWKIKNNALSIPIAQLEKGVYMLAINSLEQKVSTKFLKQ